MHDVSVKSLREYYKVNLEPIGMLKDKFPEKKDELDELVKTKKKQIEEKLSAKEAESNG